MTSFPLSKLPNDVFYLVTSMLPIQDLAALSGVDRNIRKVVGMSTEWNKAANSLNVFIEIDKRLSFQRGYEIKKDLSQRLVSAQTSGGAIYKKMFYVCVGYCVITDVARIINPPIIDPISFAYDVGDSLFYQIYRNYTHPLFQNFVFKNCVGCSVLNMALRFIEVENNPRYFPDLVRSVASIKKVGFLLFRFIGGSSFLLGLRYVSLGHSLEGCKVLLAGAFLTTQSIINKREQETFLSAQKEKCCRLAAKVQIRSEVFFRSPTGQKLSHMLHSVRSGVDQRIAAIKRRFFGRTVPRLEV